MTVVASHSSYPVVGVLFFIIFYFFSSLPLQGFPKPDVDIAAIRADRQKVIGTFY